MTEIREVAGLPVTPYNGTGGWSGTQTSKDRAERMVSTGELSRTQAIVVQQLGARRYEGCTVHEIEILREDGNGYMHHGSVSGALSNLHQHKKISRLAEKRNNCHIYVLNHFAKGRELSAFTPHKRHKTKFSLSDKPKPLTTGDRLEKRDAIMALLISRRLDQPTPAYEYMQLADKIVSLFDIQGD